jgi:hypothetical protein
MDADYTTIDGKGHNFTVEWLGKINNNANAYPELMENYNVLPSEITFNTPQGYFGFLSAKARIMLRGDGNIADGEKISAGVDPGKTRAVDLSVVYAVPYGSENYYIQGPTKIIYNSLGTLDGTAMYNTPYKLFCRKGVSINGNTYGRDEEI